MDPVEAWKKCVRKAKKKLGITDKFTLIKGNLLKEAQKCYCAMGF